MAWRQYPQGEGRGDENGNVEELIGDAWTPTRTGGAEHVTTGGPSGTIENRTATINNATDLPTDETAVVVGELITMGSFSTGLYRVRVTFHSTASGTNIPFAGAVGVVVNGSASAAATELSIADISEGDAGNADNGPRMVSQTQSVIEFDLTASGEDVDAVYLVGYAPGGTGVAIVHVSIEVW